MCVFVFVYSVHVSMESSHHLFCTLLIICKVSKPVNQIKFEINKVRYWLQKSSKIFNLLNQSFQNHCLTISWTELEYLSESWVRPKRMGFPWTSDLAIYIIVKQPWLRILGFGSAFLVLPLFSWEQKQCSTFVFYLTACMLPFGDMKINA